MTEELDRVVETEFRPRKTSKTGIALVLFAFGAYAAIETYNSTSDVPLSEVAQDAAVAVLDSFRDCYQDFRNEWDLFVEYTKNPWM